MPRPDPLTQHAINSRAKLGFSLIQASTKDQGRVPPGTSESQRRCLRNFNDALDILGVTGARTRTRSRNELALICKLYELVRLVEDQETPARKREAFQRASRPYRRRQSALRDIEIASRLWDEGDKGRAKQLFASAIRTLRSGEWLAQSLEQEVHRLQSEGLSAEESFRALRDRYRRESRVGHHASHALRDTIHRLQAFASGIDKRLKWRDRRSPPKLIPFIIAVLTAAKIKHSGFVNNPSKLRRMMIKPPPGPTVRAEKPSCAAPTHTETELEQPGS
jgi:hypothetical protein